MAGSRASGWIPSRRYACCKGGSTIRRCTQMHGQVQTMEKSEAEKRMEQKMRLKITKMQSTSQRLRVFHPLPIDREKKKITDKVAFCCQPCLRLLRNLVLMSVAWYLPASKELPGR